VIKQLYSRHILPRLIDWSMGSDEIARYRQDVIPAARGIVVEIGVGSGLNLPFYDRSVTKLYGVDLSRELLALARSRAAALQFGAEFLQQDADRLPFDDDSVDTVVVTWSLCSIADPATALGEMWRVLRPGGTLIFVEHGLAPDARVRRWQNRLTPLWRHVAGGCHLNRKPDELIRDAGFAISQMRAEYIPGPKVGAYMYAGRGRKADT
jgi:SAM-dependent methyltransferase